MDASLSASLHPAALINAGGGHSKNVEVIDFCFSRPELRFTTTTTKKTTKQSEDEGSRVLPGLDGVRWGPVKTWSDFKNAMDGIFETTSRHNAGQCFAKKIKQIRLLLADSNNLLIATEPQSR